MSGKSATEWVGYPPSSRVQRDSLPYTATEWVGYPPSSRVQRDSLPCKTATGWVGYPPSSRVQRDSLPYTATEWVGYPPSSRVQRDSLPSTSAGNGEIAGCRYLRVKRIEHIAYSGDGIIVSSSSKHRVSPRDSLYTTHFL